MCHFSGSFKDPAFAGEQPTEPFKILVVQVHNQQPTGDEVAPDASQARRLVLRHQQVLEGVPRDDRQAERFTQVESAHITFYPAHVGLVSAFLARNIQHCSRDIDPH
jgi:hypothetical protein